MINVTIFRDSQGTIRRFSVLGHAGFARKGEDVVCAAASILAINTVNSIEALTSKTVEITVDKKNGGIDCALHQRENEMPDDGAELLIKSMIIGFKSMEEQYGEYIRIEEASYD